MIVTTGELYRVAYGDFAFGAYNVNNMEQVLGLFEGHRRARSPFIVQISRGARRYAGARMLETIIRAAEERYPELIFAVHLDHGDEETCYDAIDSGFYSSVMIDASHEPFAENVAITRRVVERAHPPDQCRGRARRLRRRGHRGRRGACSPDRPDEALAFVQATGCDARRGRGLARRVQVRGERGSARPDRRDPHRSPACPRPPRRELRPGRRGPAHQRRGGGLDPAPGVAIRRSTRDPAGICRSTLIPMAGLSGPRVQCEALPRAGRLRLAATRPRIHRRFRRLRRRSGRGPGSAGQLDRVREALAA